MPLYKNFFKWLFLLTKTLIIRTELERGFYMVNEVVKYHNDLNTVPMRNWTAEEMDFFFAILAKVRDKGTDTFELDTDELKKISRFADKHQQRWADTMENVAKNLSQLTYIERTTEKISVMTLFSQFDIYPKDRKIAVRVSSNFDYIVNRISANFTTYELAEFTQIRSTYAKTVYRLLKQWRTVGKKEFTIDDFKRLLDTPEYYGPSHIDKNILNPVMRELPVFFKNLKIKKVKANTRGTPVKSYIFSWKPEKTGEYDPNKFEKKTYRKPLKFESKPDWLSEKKELSDTKMSEEDKANFMNELKKKYPNFFDEN